MMPPARKPKAFAPDPDAPHQLCAAPGCPLEGQYRAPKSRESLREFTWYCLEHVRQFNAAWDYYKGMSPAEIEAQLRADTAWQRPSWPLGQLGTAARLEDAVHAELHAFNFTGPKAPPPVPRAPPELREALGILGLSWPVSMAAVKAQYKLLAKRYHPDANGGDKASEEMLKSINLAYAALRGKLPAMSGQAA